MSESAILAPGLHDIEEIELKNHFLSDFPSSKTRAPLINGFSKFVDKLKEFNITFEIWLDGSFTTNKENPNDIDLVVFGSENDLNKLPEAHQIKLRGLLLDRATTKHRFGCDVLFSVTEDQNMRSYWRGWYGFDRNENPKGIARLVVNP